MTLFRRRAASPVLPRAAACFPTPAMTRRAADWLRALGGCAPLGILSDDCPDVVWQCAAERVDLLLLGTDFSGETADTKDVSARCDIAIEVRRQRPACRVYLVCEEGCPEKRPALEKAVELKLIDGYFVGELTAQQAKRWIAETAEAMARANEARRV